MLIKMLKDFECEIENIRYSKKGGNAFKKDQEFDANFAQVLFLVEKKRVAEIVRPAEKKVEPKEPAPKEPVVDPVVNQGEKEPVKTTAKPKKRASRKRK